MSDSEAAAQPGALTACDAIICAYNEAGRVERVARALLDSKLFARVLVVDDASTDATAAEAAATGAEVLSHTKNQGKAAAMRSGLAATSSPLVCYIDADLLGITSAHLAALLQPVQSGAAKASLGVFKGGRTLTSLAQAVSPMISGQRCLLRTCLDGFSGWDSGYGIETTINAYLLTQGIESQIVYWQGASQVMKEEKWGFWRGLGTRLKMYWQILIAWLLSKSRPRGS